MQSRYLEEKPHQLKLVFMPVLYGIGILVFQEGGKLDNTDGTKQTQLGIEPRPHWWEASAVTLAPVVARVTHALSYLSYVTRGQVFNAGEVCMLTPYT